MSYITLEVDVADGRILPKSGEQLPRQARGLLTLLEPLGKSMNCGDLADWWAARDRLPVSDAESFAQDLEDARKTLPPAKDSWA